MAAKAITLSTLTICGTIIAVMPWLYLMYLTRAYGNPQPLMHDSFLYLFLLITLISTIVGGGVLLFAIIMMSNIKDK
jgi:hypothetical protein